MSCPKRFTSFLIGLGIILSLSSACGNNSTPNVTTPNTSLNPTGGIPGVGGSGACMPITQQIGFQGQNVIVTSQEVVGGVIPPAAGSQWVNYGSGFGGGIGTLTVGGGGGAGQYQFQRSGPDGFINIGVFQNGFQNQFNFGGVYGTYNQSTANIQGFVQLSQLTTQDIMYQFGGGYLQGSGFLNPLGANAFNNPAFNPYVPQGYGYNSFANQVCVSGIAIDLRHYNNLLHSGYVYLYLNHTPHGYALYF